MGEALGSSGASTAIDSSNIGFQLLKKHGWKEGTGLGVSEQGRLEPVEAHVKNNKRGLGAEKKRKKPPKPVDSSESDYKPKHDEEQKSSKKTKALSKRLRKLQEQEKLIQEKEFERAFFREFWPDNV